MDYQSSEATVCKRDLETHGGEVLGFTLILVYKGHLYKELPVGAYASLALFSTVLIRDSYTGYLTMSLINHIGCILSPIDRRVREISLQLARFEKSYEAQSSFSSPPTTLSPL